MQPNQIKFHLIAVTALCAIVFLLFVSMNAEQGRGPQAASSNRLIFIESATYGRNCDAAVDSALQLWQKKIHPPEELYKKPKKAIHNNALPVASQLCNGQTSCEINASDEALNVPPIDKCYKILTVRYRCGMYDRLREENIEEEKSSVLTCSKSSRP